MCIYIYNMYNLYIYVDMCPNVYVCMHRCISIIHIYYILSSEDYMLNDEWWVQQGTAILPHNLNLFFYIIITYFYMENILFCTLKRY